MAKMREVILGQSESDVQRKFNEWQQRTAGKVSEVEWRVDWRTLREGRKRLMNRSPK